MADLIVRPSYQLTETDILTVDKLNLMATPVVDLSLETPVNDQNYFRNGNFYSSFWTTPAGVSVGSAAWTGNASYWIAKTSAGTATYKRSTDVPDLFSLFSAQLVGATGVGSVSFGQQISGDLSAPLRRPCTFSSYIENTTGLVLNPTLQFWTCNAFNNFNAVTLQTTVNLQSCANASWTFVNVTKDVSTLANVANGLFVVLVIPAGSLANTAQSVNFSRLKFQIGEVATEFSDDPSLFVQSPSVDSTMLQDGCIARPSLFLPHVVPQGAYVAGSIQSADIGAGQVLGSNLGPTAVHDSLGYTPVNKGGDTGIGQLAFSVDTVVGAAASTAAAVQIDGTSANASNNGYDPMLSFNRPGLCGRTIGLTPTRRYRTVDDQGTVGYLLDSVTGVDTNSYQAGSITLQALAQSLINIIIPPGMVRMFGGPTIPTGWLACDGSPVSRTTYAALYAAIGTYWGVGDNISTFNLPDFRGRSPLGYVNTALSGITSRAFASNGGEENHLLNSNEMPNHNHTLHETPHSHSYQDNGHSHTFSGSMSFGYTVSGNQIRLDSQGSPLGGWIQPNTTGITINSASTGIHIDPAGAGVTHNNMSPFAVVYFIIKT